MLPGDRYEALVQNVSATPGQFACATRPHRLKPVGVARVLNRLGACLAMGMMGGPAALRSQPAQLTTIAEVRMLSEEEARRALPVRLRGIYLGEADPEGIAFVIGDETQGIYVQGPPQLVAGLQRGDLLEIEGVSDPGGYAPYIVARNLTKIGRAPIPGPGKVTLDELDVGRVDAKWVEFSGIVRSVERKAARDVAPPPPGTRYEAPSAAAAAATPKVKMTLASGAARLVVQISADLDPEAYVDAEVRVQGLCFNLHNRNRQFLKPFVQVPRGVPLTVVTPPATNPFDSAPSPVAGLLRFEQLMGRPGHRVHVRGTVIHHQPGVALWIRDGEHSLRVTTGQRAPLRPGDEVDVAGFPARGGYSAVLEDAIFRRRSTQAPLPPLVLPDGDSALQHDAEFVQLEGRLTELRRYPDSIALTLEWQNTLVPARLYLPGDAVVPVDWRPGSMVRVSGICTVITDEQGPLGGLWLPRAFELLLRSPADLAVTRPAPWWTTERVVWILAGALAAAVGAVAVVMLASRRRLKEQEHRRAMAETEFAAILGERNRVAREIHDTLSQGLGAISVQLELARKFAGEISAPARQHLATAHKLARESLAEARVSIWNMRSQVLERRDLAEALEGILNQLATGTAARPAMHVTGDRRRLSPVVENNLLRIGQEAITNAVKHAKASTIAVRLEFERRTVRLIVEDDGTGFTEQPVPEGERRSFGLIGIRERMDLLGGRAEITSQPQHGTRVAVVVSA